MAARATENLWLRLHRARARFLKTFQEIEAESGETDAQARRPSDGRYGHAG